MEDFNEPSEERVGLLKRLEDAMPPKGTIGLEAEECDGGTVPPPFWAACQICDIKALDNFVGFACKYPANARIVAAQTRLMVQYWIQRTPLCSTPQRSEASNPSSNSPSPAAKRLKTTNSPRGYVPLVRNKAASDLAKERDGKMCVLTGSGLVEVAHIYPFSQLKYPEEDTFGARHIFWDHLKNFWPEEKVTTWIAQLFPRGLCRTGDERVDNQITLSRDAHGLWNRGAFALKPISISDDKTTLEVQFFWQKRQANTKPAMSLLITPYSTRGLEQDDTTTDAGINVLHDERRHGVKIKSGDVFELKTDDVAQQPLPSFQLLELQWFLTRVVGMAGAAFPDDLDSEYDSDEDVPALTVGEAWDESFIFDQSLLDPPRYEARPEGPEHEAGSVESDSGEVGVRV